ncbi:MAG: hypothetical protein MZV63_07210 [Marinilabiliales bacterium]|nr:hypothetical protein [Marinilabiliales bacterium]
MTGEPSSPLAALMALKVSLDLLLAPVHATPTCRDGLKPWIPPTASRSKANCQRAGQNGWGSLKSPVSRMAIPP